MPERFPTYYIIKEHPLRIISKCKSHSKGTLMSFLVGICVLYIFLNWIPDLLSLAFPVTNVDIMSGMKGVDLQLLNMMPRTPMVVYIYVMLFSGVFRLGEALYTLTYIRNRKVEYRALAEGLPFYGKTLALYIIQVLIIAFWGLLFVIPGLIAALNFSQSFYILADDPSKGILQVLSESKMMMVGNRISYIRLMLYYLPYLMLSYIPSILLSELVLRLSAPDAAVVITGLIAAIPVYAANGYIDLGRAVFYELLTNEGFATFRYAGQEAFRELEQ